MNVRQRLATVIRRIPLLMRIPYYLYRVIQPKYSVGVIGVVINDAHEVLLVEHVFHPKLPWGLPGGWIGFNEDPRQTIAREIDEELGLAVTVERLLLAIRTEYHHLDFAFLCKPTGTINALSYELLDYAWYARQDLPYIHPFHYQAIETAFEILKNE
ncbi:MAG: NUDIX hydrolase [Anaerolineae bacterium]